jgi:hypothetical protein
VDYFPVEKFCDEIESTGAKWVIWPLGHGEALYCTPNATLEAMAPGCCSKRDLFGEIAQNLTGRGLKVMAYLTTNACGETFPDALGWNDDPSDKKEFQKKYARVVREWSERYGKLISGWWFDSCYAGPRTGFTWDETRFEGSGWREAVLAGNPDSVYCFNPGANTFQYVFDDEGYLAGEANDLKVRPGRPLIGDKQWHSLIWIDCFWFHTDPNRKIDAPRFYDNELHDYLYTCHQNGGGVTINIGIYRDGSLAEDSLEQVRRMGQLMKDGTPPKPYQKVRRLYN